jgi:uncharacterized coiled-coil DUF342 family protein
MKLFDDSLLQKIKECGNRWKDIDDAVNQLKNSTATKNPDLENVIRVVLLLVEQLRPLSSTGKQVEELEEEIQDIFNKAMSGGH